MTGNIELWLITYELPFSDSLQFISQVRYLACTLADSEFFLDFNFDKTYQNTGSKTQNVEELSQDLIFYDNFW